MVSLYNRFRPAFVFFVAPTLLLLLNCSLDRGLININVAIDKPISHSQEHHSNLINLRFLVFLKNQLL